MRDLKAKYFSRPARISRKAVNQTQYALQKGERPTNSLSAIETEGFRRRGSVALVANLFLTGGSPVRRQLPACSRTVENLDSPQHDDDGRYQRGRRQYTF
jgi:hypothetical protein